MNNNTKRRIWLTQEQQTEVVKRYTAGETPAAIGESLGVCANNIRNTIRKNGAHERGRSEARTRLSHWKEAFDVVTPESAYWIGFLFADGTVHQQKHGSPDISIGLAARDADHIRKFRTFLKSEHKIRFTQTKGNEIEGRVIPSCPHVSFSLRSAFLANALEKYGMRRKSLDRVVSQDLLYSRDFWRGLVDGDGWISISKSNNPRLGVCGGLGLMNQFMTFLRANNIGFNTSVRTQKTIHLVAFSCGSAFEIINLLYNDCAVALDRKLVRAKQIIETKTAA